MDQLKELELTFIEEYESAILLEKNQKLKSVTILLSKAMFALVDYILYKKYQKLPKNHNDRFRMLEIKEKEIYEKLNSVWNKYTDTYSKPAIKESIIMLKNTIKEISKNETISSNIKKIIEG